MKPKRTIPHAVKASELTTLKMSCGNAKKFSRVIEDGMVKNWVGIGWVTEHKATAKDMLRYPKVT